MSIERSQSSTQPDAARDVGRDKADTRPREPAPREKVDDFQRLLQGKREQREPRLPTQPEEARKRSEEHTSELQSLMRISYAVFCMKKKHMNHSNKTTDNIRQTYQRRQRST